MLNYNYSFEKAQKRVDRRCSTEKEGPHAPTRSNSTLHRRQNSIDYGVNLNKAKRFSVDTQESSLSLFRRGSQSTRSEPVSPSLKEFTSFIETPIDLDDVTVHIKNMRLSHCTKEYSLEELNEIESDIESATCTLMDFLNEKPLTLFIEKGSAPSLSSSMILVDSDMPSVRLEAVKDQDGTKQLLQKLFSRLRIKKNTT